MKRAVYKTDGSNSGSKADLNEAVFAVVPNEQLIYEDVRRHLSNRRQGTASTKERGEVRGGGKKAYKQKGTGMARRGSIRSPLLKGGGTVFGPKPRSYKVKMSKKMRQGARKSALSIRLAENAVKIIEDFSLDAPKTSHVAGILDSFEATGKKVLILTAKPDTVLFKSARNIPGVEVTSADSMTTYQILNADLILIQNSGLDVIEATLTEKVDGEAA